MNNFYEGIDDLPIYNWNKVHETGDLSFIMIKKKKLSEAQQISAGEQWKVIYDEYISKFGFSEDFLTILEKETYISMLILEKAETGDESINTMIEIVQHEINKMKASVPASDFYGLKTSMEKELKFRIDIKDCSVNEFYSYLKTLSKK